MPKIYDVVKAMGSYTDASGQEKTRWLNCGMIIKNQKGNVSLKLDALPIGTPVDGDGGMWFALMKPQPRDGQQRPPAPQQNTAPQPAQTQAAPAQDGGWGQGAGTPAGDQYAAEDDIPF